QSAEKEVPNADENVGHCWAQKAPEWPLKVFQEIGPLISQGVVGRYKQAPTKSDDTHGTKGVSTLWRLLHPSQMSGPEGETSVNLQDSRLPALQVATYPHMANMWESYSPALADWAGGKIH
ncbi:hypothetical protein Hamer_G021747, partial [Homarus americanus]